MLNARLDKEIFVFCVVIITDCETWRSWNAGAGQSQYDSLMQIT